MIELIKSTKLTLGSSDKFINQADVETVKSLKNQFMQKERKKERKLKRIL